MKALYFPVHNSHETIPPLALFYFRNDAEAWRSENIQSSRVIVGESIEVEIPDLRTSAELAVEIAEHMVKKFSSDEPCWIGDHIALYEAAKAREAK